MRGDSMIGTTSPCLIVSLCPVLTSAQDPARNPPTTSLTLHIERPDPRAMVRGPQRGGGSDPCCAGRPALCVMGVYTAVALVLVILLQTAGAHDPPASPEARE